MFALFSLYLDALIGYLFNRRQPATALDYSKKRLFEQQSFRFPEKARHDRWIVLRVAKRAISLLFKRTSLNEALKEGDAIFDSDLRSVKLRRDYVERLSGRVVKRVYGRSELLRSSPFFLRIVLLVLVCVCVLPLFVISILSKDKLKAAIWLTNLTEGLSLLALLKRDHCRTVWFFNIYENDANILALALMKEGIVVNKIASEVPLQFWNSVVVADKLCLCFRYQEDEYRKYASTMFVKDFQHWIPETALLLESFYRDKVYVRNPGTIGFYSSGMWMRKQLGDVDLKDNPLKNETDLFLFLAEFAKETKNVKLIVFLHPIEKKDMEKTRNYYAVFGDNIEFANPDIPNDQQFYMADVAVSLYSTMSYNRIFWGFKTLIFPAGHEAFPIEGSVFANVCTRNWAFLREKLEKSLNQESDVFFEQNGLRNYQYKAYLSQNPHLV